MKQLVCEMCGSTDLIKQDGVFVCQACGCKYSVEDARKMMSDEPMEVTGTVQIDSSDRIANLYKLARRARIDNNIGNAAQYYSEIVIEAPDDWEAAFYSAYYKVKACNGNEIFSDAEAIINCLEFVMPLIKDDVPLDQQKAAYSEVIHDALDIISIFFRASTRAFAYGNEDYSVREREFTIRLSVLTRMVVSVANLVDKYFEDVSLVKMIYEESMQSYTFLDYADNMVEIFEHNLSNLLEKYQKQADKKYWSEHSEELQNLNDEKNLLEQQVSEYKQELMNSHEQKQLNDCIMKVEELKKEKSTISIFKGKERKDVQECLDTALAEKEEAEKRFKSLEYEINDKITKLQVRIGVINSELTKKH